MYWSYLLCAVLGYLLCNINVAVLLGKWKGVDIRAVGTNNPGASNVFLSLGPAMGVLVGALDILKTAAAVVIAKLVFPDALYIGYVTGVACILGNLFPCFHGFRGGKGFATFVGMTLGMHWQFFLGLVVVVALITLFSGYIVFGTLLSITAYPVYVFFMDGAWIPVMIIAVASLAMLYRHRENFMRLREMKEMKLDLFHRK